MTSPAATHLYDTYIQPEGIIKANIDERAWDQEHTYGRIMQMFRSMIYSTDECTQEQVELSFKSIIDEHHDSLHIESFDTYFLARTTLLIQFL